jgi:hypothetical protein
VTKINATKTIAVTARDAVSPPKRRESILATIVPLNKAIAFTRWIFYRPIPVYKGCGTKQYNVTKINATKTIAVTARDGKTSSIFPPKRRESILATIVPLNKAIAFTRWIFYRPIPVLRA